MWGSSILIYTALPEDIRTQMESSFGTNFSGVRIHTNNSSVQMNKELSAQAFTHGSDIYFNAGKYDPETTSGKHLLAHELTHTVQQGSGKRPSIIQKYALNSDPSFVTDPYPPGNAPGRILNNGHKTIQSNFRATHENLAHTELRIPGANSAPVNADNHPSISNNQSWDPNSNPAALRLGHGRSDIALRFPTNGLKIADIKPAKSWLSGERQSQYYVDQIRQQDPIMREWRRSSFSVPIFTRNVGLLRKSKYSPPKYMRTEGDRIPIEVQWVTPGVIGYRPLGGEEDIFICGFDDNGLFDRFIERGMTEGRAVIQERIDEFRTILLNHLGELTQGKIREILGPLITDYLIQELGPEFVVRIRAMSSMAINRFLDQLQETASARLLEFIKFSLQAACAGATVLTLEIIRDLIEQNVDRIIGEALQEIVLVIVAKVVAYTVAAIISMVIAAIAIYYLILAAIEAGILVALQAVFTTIVSGLRALIPILRGLRPTFPALSPIFTKFIGQTPSIPQLQFKMNEKRSRKPPFLRNSKSTE